MFFSQLALVLLLNSPAQAAENNRAVCPEILTTAQPTADTQTFIKLIRAIVEKNVLSSSALANLASTREPTNPIVSATTLAPEEAYSFSKAFERLLANKQLNWNLIRAEFESLSGKKAEKEIERSQNSEKTASIPAVVSVAKHPEPFDGFSYASLQNVFSSRSGNTFAFFGVRDNPNDPPRSWLVELMTGKTQRVDIDRWVEPAYLETSSGKVLMAYADLKSVRILDADSGKPFAKVDLSDVDVLKDAQSDKFTSWKPFLVERPEKQSIEVLIAHNSGRINTPELYAAPVWVDVKTGTARPVNQPPGDYSYFQDHEGHVISYGFVENGNATQIVVRDLNISDKPILQLNLSSPAERVYNPLAYRSRSGAIYVASHDGKDNLVRIYSDRTASAQQFKLHDWTEHRTFFEDERSNTYYLIGDTRENLTLIDTTNNTETTLTPRVRLKAQASAGYYIRKSIQLVSPLGPLLIYLEKDANAANGLVVLYNLITGQIAEMKGDRLNASSPISNAYVTPDGRLHAVYGSENGIELFQLFGPANTPLKSERPR